MASSDLRDVLNLDAQSGPRPAKKQKTTASRPNLKGLAREVQSLGGDNPIAIVPETSVFKKKRLASRKPATTWELRAFQNSSRQDEGKLVLRHWRKKTDTSTAADNAEATASGEQQRQQEQDSTAEQPQQTEEQKPALEDSSFAKYNVQVNIPQYNDDLYHTNLTNPDWTKAETDYLMDLVKEYDLRWPLVWDRYDYVPEAIDGEASADGDESKAIIPVPKARTVEDLKARYYEIAAKTMAAQTSVQFMSKDEFALHEMMTGFNPAQESQRKDFATSALSRTKEEANEEESLLIELKRILQRNATFNEERRELYNRLDYPHTDQDISAFKSSAGLHNLLQNLASVDKNKKRRSLAGAAGPDGTSPSQAGQQNGSGEGGSSAGNRRDSIAASTSGQRDSIGSAAQTPTTEKASGGGNKKGQQQQQQERRKLSDTEKLVYGVSHHDRLSAGPTFRYERINKLFTSKSGQQQIRMTNVLNELDIPGRLVMPTAAVTAQFEQLLGAVSSLIDARKVTDKIDAEMKLEAAKKAEREEREKPVDKEPTPSKGGEGVEGEEQEQQDGEKAKGIQPEITNEEANTGQQGEGGEEEKGKAGQQQRQREGGSRPPSSGGNHKRSASVLSSFSDKSTKRQKK